MGLIAKVNKDGRPPEEARFAGFVGSTVEWNQFCDLADELPLEEYEELVSLCEHGVTYPLDTLRDQLAKLKADGPARAARDNLLGICRDAGDATTIGIYDEYAEG